MKTMIFVFVLLVLGVWAQEAPPVAPSVPVGLDGAATTTVAATSTAPATTTEATTRARRRGRRGSPTGVEGDAPVRKQKRNKRKPHVVPGCVELLRARNISWEDLVQRGENPEDECRKLAREQLQAPSGAISEQCREQLELRGLSVAQLLREGRVPSEVCQVMLGMATTTTTTTTTTTVAAATTVTTAAGATTAPANATAANGTTTAPATTVPADLTDVSSVPEPAESVAELRKMLAKVKEALPRCETAHPTEASRLECRNKIIAVRTRVTRMLLRKMIAARESAPAIDAVRDELRPDNNDTIAQVRDGLKRIDEALPLCKERLDCLERIETIRRNLVRSLVRKLRVSGAPDTEITPLLASLNHREVPDSLEDLRMALVQLRKGYAHCEGRPACMEAIEAAVKSLKKRLATARSVPTTTTTVATTTTKAPVVNGTTAATTVTTATTATTTVTSTTTTTAPVSAEVPETVADLQAALANVRRSYAYCEGRESCIAAVEVAVHRLNRRIAALNGAPLPSDATTDPAAGRSSSPSAGAPTSTLDELRSSLRQVRLNFANCNGRTACVEAMEAAERDLLRQIAALDASGATATGGPTVSEPTTTAAPQTLAQLRATLRELRERRRNCRADTACVAALRPQIIDTRRLIIEHLAGPARDAAPASAAGASPERPESVDELRASLVQVRMGYSHCGGRASCINALELAVQDLKRKIAQRNNGTEESVLPQNEQSVWDLRRALRDARRGYLLCEGRAPCLAAVEQAVDALRRRITALVPSSVIDAVGVPRDQFITETVDELRASLAAIRRGYERCGTRQVCLEAVEHAVREVKNRIAARERQPGSSTTAAGNATTTATITTTATTRAGAAGRGAALATTTRATTTTTTTTATTTTTPALSPVQQAARSEVEKITEELNVARVSLEFCAEDAHCLAGARERVVALETRLQVEAQIVAGSGSATTAALNTPSPALLVAREHLLKLTQERDLAREGLTHCADDAACRSNVEANVAQLQTLVTAAEADVAAIASQTVAPAAAAAAVGTTVASTAAATTAPVPVNADEDSAVSSVTRLRLDLREARRAFVFCGADSACVMRNRDRMHKLRADLEAQRERLRLVRSQLESGVLKRTLSTATTTTATTTTRPVAATTATTTAAPRPTLVPANATLVQLRTQLVQARASYATCKGNQTCLDAAEALADELKERIQGAEPPLVSEMRKLIRQARQRYVACGTDQDCLTAAERDVDQLRQRMVSVSTGSTRRFDDFEEEFYHLPLPSTTAVDASTASATTRPRGGAAFVEDTPPAALAPPAGLPSLKPEEDEALLAAGIDKNLLGSEAHNARRIARRLLWDQLANRQQVSQFRRKLVALSEDQEIVDDLQVGTGRRTTTRTRAATTRRITTAAAAAVTTAATTAAPTATVQSGPTTTVEEHDVEDLSTVATTVVTSNWALPAEDTTTTTTTTVPTTAAPATIVVELPAETTTGPTVSPVVAQEMAILAADLAAARSDFNNCGGDDLCVTRVQRQIRLLRARLEELRKRLPVTTAATTTVASTTTVPASIVDSESVRRLRSQLEELRSELQRCGSDRSCMRAVRRQVAYLRAELQTARNDAASESDAAAATNTAAPAGENGELRAAQEELKECNGESVCLRSVSRAIRRIYATRVQALREDMQQCSDDTACLAGIRERLTRLRTLLNTVKIQQ